MIPCRIATRANGIPEDPAIRVLSKSKNAAARGGIGLPGLRARDLDDDRVTLAAAAADRRDAESSAAASKLVNQRADDPRPGGPDRVTKGDRAAVDVDVVLADAQHPDRVEGNR